MRLIFALACMAGIFLIGGCATESAAKKRPATIEEMFKRADANSDGRVSREEFTDFMVEDFFSRYNRDGDGSVEEAEFIAGGGTVETFRKINRSGSGKITLDEAKTSKAIRDRMVVPFDEADVDNNGYVTWVEFQQQMERARPYIR